MRDLYEPRNSVFSPNAWKCTCFGVSSNTLVLYLPEGKQPNAWYRFWQRVLIGNKWERM